MTEMMLWRKSSAVLYVQTVADLLKSISQKDIPSTCQQGVISLLISTQISAEECNVKTDDQSKPESRYAEGNC